MNNKLSTILNIILLIAVTVLFILVLGNRKSSNKNLVNAENDSTVQKQIAIAYINTDSLLLNYELAKESNEKLIKKQENSRVTLNTKAKHLQREMKDFQRKLEAQAFLSRERAEKAQAEIVKKQQNLQQTEARLTQKLLEEQQKVSEQLRDTINNFLKEYNKDGKYEYIINNNNATDNILYAKPVYDITDEVIELLNKRYKK